MVVNKVMKTKEIPAGYKQTEVGVIPADWVLVSYEEAFKFLHTAAYSWAQLKSDGKIRYIHYGDIHTKWNNFVDLNQELPTIDDVKVCNYDLIEDGDVIMADASEDYEGICKSVEVINKNNLPAISGLHTFLLRDKGDYFVSGFRGYIHLIKFVRNTMNRLATGLKVYGVSKTNLKLIQIPRPPLPEQTAIANVLSDIDMLIKELEKLIAKKRAIKQGAMQELLTGKRRLPGFSGEWENKILEDIIEDIADGGTPPTSNPSCFGGEINWVVIADIEDEIYSTRQTLTELGLYRSSSKLWKPETIILSTGATIGVVGIAKVFTATKQGICGIVVKENTSNLFLKYWFKQNKSTLIEMAQGSSIREVRPPILIKIEIKIPKDKNEQLAIAQVLGDIDSEIDKLEQKLEKYKMIKQGIMQVLLTGKIRLV